MNFLLFQTEDDEPKINCLIYNPESLSMLRPLLTSSYSRPLDRSYADMRQMNNRNAILMTRSHSQNVGLYNVNLILISRNTFFI